MPANFTPDMKGYSGQGAFRFWCQAVLPLVYDDSLSYMELLNKMVIYLNNTISDVAAMEDNVEALYNAYNELQACYNQLEKFVNDYFDNLDVQEEINNKLDAMVTDGTMDAIVEPFVNARIGSEVTSWLNEYVDPVGSAVVVDSSLSIQGAAADAKTTGEIRTYTPTLRTSVAQTIPANTDYDTITTPGSYRVIYSAEAETMENCPTISAHRLFVLTLSSSSAIMQYIITGVGRQFYRFYYGNAWHDWVKPLNSSNIDATLSTSGAPADAKAVSDALELYFALDASEANVISNNSDYNDITTPGNYKVTTPANVATMTNCPTITPHRLIVLTAGNADTYIQYVINSHGIIFTREHHSSGWSDWLKVTYNLDTTLARSDYAADAKAVGDALQLYFALNASEAIVLPDNTDYNTVTTPGDYKVTTSQKVATMTNCPTTTPHRFLVFTAGNADTTIQYVINSHGVIFNRGYYASSWHEWTRVTNIFDTTLMLSDMAAASNSVGKFIDDISPTVYPSMLSWELGKSYHTSGIPTTPRGASLSEKITVSPGMHVHYTGNFEDEDEITLYCFLATFNGNTWVARVNIQDYTNNTYVVPDNVDTIQFIFGYPSSATDKSMDYYTISANFRAKIGEAQPEIKTKDAPWLVAFGASTTDCTVWTYGNRSRSIYQWPDYVANALGMNSLNLGIGTTGFLARTGGNNFLDQIYNNDDALKKASLVIIMFGYGNDKAAGLPIGEYTDYYPYDETGYHPAGQEGVTEMISKGITLFGALNWCIKWISQKYPMAQIIPIFGSPSTNRNKTISMTAQTEGEGVAPYTLTFADPSNTDADTIRTELDKLRDALNIPILDMSQAGNAAFNWWQIYSTEQFTEGGDEYTRYALFSNMGTLANPEWNQHPSNKGYLRYARILTGRIQALYGYGY